MRLLFATSLLATLLVPVRLFFFVPFLVLFIYKNNVSTSLWMAFLCGLVLDFLTPGNRLGLISLNFTLATLLLFQLKQYFFVDRMSTLPLMTFLFGAFAACLQLLLEGIFQGNLRFSASYVTWDIILMPVCDALFALLATVFMQFVSFKKRART